MPSTSHAPKRGVDRGAGFRVLATARWWHLHSPESTVERGAMKPVARFVAVATVLVLLVAGSSSADPIGVTITSGFLDIKGGSGGFGPISLVGTNGFSLTSGVDVSGGNFAPANVGIVRTRLRLRARHG
jgi:hypothetical protein